MSAEPILVYLHGVGDGDQDDVWRKHLTRSLQSLGYPSLDSIQVIAPKYAHALKGSDDRESVPEVTLKQLSRDAARKNRRDFERRVGAIEFRLGRHDRGEGRPILDAAAAAALRFPKFAQASNYIKDNRVRARVLNRILEHLPTSGKLVIVGHSLGSVIAADLVNRLPVGLDVVGMITIGSPLANGNFDVEKLRDTLKEPPTNLGWWVNFWNPQDPVASHRGASSAFPWLIDFRVETEKVLDKAHDASEYLSSEDVATAIGFALFGSRSREIVAAEEGLDLPTDYAEDIALLALRYAHLAKARLEGDLQDRFSGALRQVQAAAVTDIRNRNHNENRATPSQIVRLAFDLSDPDAIVPEPLPGRHFTKEQAVVPLTVLASENVIRPFEINIPAPKWQEAIKDLTAEMGLGSQFGADVFAAAKQAQEALSGRGGVNWLKWGALGAGAAALVVATGGLALAAGAGLAGAAAITSALAAFGPGGMIGGLLTAGSLVMAGGGGLAFGLASSGTTPETLEAIIQRRLAAEILRQRQNLVSDSTVWSDLTTIEIEVRHQHERLDEFSDESAPALKELKRKIETVGRALKYLRQAGLEPGRARTNNMS